MRVCVLGAGSFGVALAELFGRLGHEVALWRRTDPLEFSLRDADWVVAAVPCQALRAVLESARGNLRAPLVLACKGLEVGTRLRMSQVVAQVLGAEHAEHVVSMSGPSFAAEIRQGHPTAVVAASRDEGRASEFAQLVFCESFRAYTTSDVTGVELAGALKNVVAIAAGAAVGLGLGHNSLAALITRGLNEMSRLAQALGAQEATFLGLAGVGDLMLTCTSAQSRNRTFGLLLGQGLSAAQAQEQIGHVVEGSCTAESAYLLAQALGIRVSIIAAVYRVLHEDQPVRSAVLDLVRREPGVETE